MQRSLLLLTLIFASAASAWSQDAASLAELKTLVKDMFTEVLAGKTDVLMAHAHPAIIKLAGGEDKMKELLSTVMRADFDAIKQAGFKITSFDVGEFEKVRTEGEWTFVLVPTTMVAEGDKGKLTMKSHTLATRKGEAGKWHLLRLAQPEARVRQWIPELPADFTWPAKQPPKFEPR